MSKKYEDIIRERFFIAGFPIEEFTFNVDEFNIDFMREFKDDIWWDEVFDWVGLNEEFVAEHHPQLMEFWKDYDKSKR